MTAIYGRFSIGCWIDPDSEDECDDEAYFDDRRKMTLEAERLLRGGRYKSIVLYEWDAAASDWRDLTELTSNDLDEAIRHQR